MTPVLPVAPVPPVTPVATTRPSEPLAQDPFGGAAQRPRRTVSLIRGGVRSEVVFDLPDPNNEQAVTSTNEGGGQQ